MTTVQMVHRFILMSYPFVLLIRFGQICFKESLGSKIVSWRISYFHLNVAVSRTIEPRWLHTIRRTVLLPGGARRNLHNIPATLAR